MGQVAMLTFGFTRVTGVIEISQKNNGENNGKNNGAERDR